MCVVLPGKVLEINGDMAIVDTNHQIRRASTVIVPETAVGDWVVVGSGAVLRILDPDEAAEIVALLDQALDQPAMQPVSAMQQEA
jgi:hydrogenase expression/formation protein HypC